MTIVTSAQISGLMGQQQAMFYNNAAASQQISAQMFPGQFQQPSPMQQSYGPPQPGPGLSAGGMATQTMAGLGKAIPGMMMTGSAVAGMVGPAALGALEPFGAGMMAARAGGGMLSAGGMAAGLGAAGAVALPYLAMQHAAKNITGGMQEQMAMNATLQNTFGTQFMGGGGRRGFDVQEMGQIGSMMRGIESVDPWTSFGELNQLVGQIHQQGLMSGVGDVQQFKTKFKQILDTTRDIAKTLGTSLSEAAGFVGDVRTSGFYTAQDIMGQARTAQVMGGYGFSGQQMRNIQRGGADLAQAYGARRRTGAVATTRQAQMIMQAVQSGTISDEDIMEATGGVGGAEGASMLAQRFAQQQFQFSTTSVGRAQLLAMGEIDEEGRYTGEIDKRQAALMRMGVTNVDNLKNTARSRLGGSRASKISFVANEERLRGAMAEEMDPQETAFAIVQQVTQRKGYAGATGDDVIQLLMKRFTSLSRGEAELMVKMAEDYSSLRMERARTIEQEMDRLEREQMRKYNSWKGWKQRQKQNITNALLVPELKDIGGQLATGAEQAVGDWESRMFGGGFTTNVSEDALLALGTGRGADPTAAYQYEAGLMSRDLYTGGALSGGTVGDILTSRGRRYARAMGQRGDVRPMSTAEWATGVPGLAARAVAGRGRRQISAEQLETHLARQRGDLSDFQGSIMDEEAAAISGEMLGTLYTTSARGARGARRRSPIEEIQATGQDPIDYLMKNMTDFEKQELGATMGVDWFSVKGDRRAQAEAESKMAAQLRKTARATSPALAAMMQESGDLDARLSELNISEIEKGFRKKVAGGMGRRDSAKRLIGTEQGKTAIHSIVQPGRTGEKASEFVDRMDTFVEELGAARAAGPESEKMKAFKSKYGIGDDVDLDDLEKTVAGMRIQAERGGDEYVADIKSVAGDLEEADRLHSQKVVAGERKKKTAKMRARLDEGTVGYESVIEMGGGAITSENVANMRKRLEAIEQAGSPGEQARLMQELTRDIAAGEGGLGGEDAAMGWAAALGEVDIFGTQGLAMGTAIAGRRGKGRIADVVSAAGRAKGKDDILAELGRGPLRESQLRKLMATEGDPLGQMLKGAVSDDELSKEEMADIREALSDFVAKVGDLEAGERTEGPGREEEIKYYDAMKRATDANTEAWKYLEGMVGAKPPGDDDKKVQDEAADQEPEGGG